MARPPSWRTTLVSPFRIPNSALRIQELFLSLMLPFTVSSANRRPPLPIVPVTRRGPRRPVTVSGKSV